MGTQNLQDKEIQNAHTNIDTFLSENEISRIAKQLFDYVYNIHGEIFKHNVPHPTTKILIAVVIYTAYRQCDGQARTFNEIANLTKENIVKIKKTYIIMDSWLCKKGYFFVFYFSFPITDITNTLFNYRSSISI